MGTAIRPPSGLILVIGVCTAGLTACDTTPTCGDYALEEYCGDARHPCPTEWDLENADQVLEWDNGCASYGWVDESELDSGGVCDTYCCISSGADGSRYYTVWDAHFTSDDFQTWVFDTGGTLVGYGTRPCDRPAGSPSDSAWFGAK